MNKKKVADSKTSSQVDEPKDFIEQLKEIYPTKTLDEIGDLLLNQYLYKRKIRIPN